MRTVVRGLLLLAAAVACLAQQAGHKTRNVIFVMSDGVRWQEAFGGADEALLNKESGVGNAEAARREYWRDSPGERRQVLMPFLWSEIVKKGQIYGNRNAGADAYVTNGFNFSYPGYSEIMCGLGDPRVDSNGKKYNPNLNVLEWLHRQPKFAGKVAAFGAWDLFPYILNAPRAGFPVVAGYDPLTVKPVTPRMELLNRLKRETYMWGGEAFDAPMYLTALEYFKQHKPRVLFVGLGEPDEWAHANRYELYLRSVRRTDEYVKELWNTAQSMPEYRGNTTLIVAVDHGRGMAPAEWKGHGQKIPGSKYVWMAFMGPDTPALGERKQIPAVTLSQVAATLAAFLGEEFTGEGGKAAKPIADAVRR